MKSWQIVAERATGLFTDWNTAELVHDGGEPASETIAGIDRPFVAQLIDVAAAIREQRHRWCRCSDGLDTLRIVLAARQSADEGARSRCEVSISARVSCVRRRRAQRGGADRDDDEDDHRYLTVVLPRGGAIGSIGLRLRVADVRRYLRSGYTSWDGSQFVDAGTEAPAT